MALFFLTHTYTLKNKHMNKIQVLIDNGFITDNDIQEYIVSNQIDYPWDNDEQDYNEPEINTEYVIASTSELMEETMVFPSNADGHITDYTDLNCVALRYGRYDWEDAFSAVAELNTDKYKYIYVRTLDSDKNVHNLFRRIDTSDAVVI
jgi:hypothetical protein